MVIRAIIAVKVELKRRTPLRNPCASPSEQNGPLQKTRLGFHLPSAIPTKRFPCELFRTPPCKEMFPWYACVTVARFRPVRRRQTMLHLSTATHRLSSTAQGLQQQHLDIVLQVHLPFVNNDSVVQRPRARVLAVQQPMACVAISCPTLQSISQRGIFSNGIEIEHHRDQILAERSQLNEPDGFAIEL